MKMDPFHSVMEQFNSGAPIPPVSASDIKQMWDATHRMNAERPPRPNVAIGLGVYAAYGVEAAASRPEEFMAIMWRYRLVSALVERGVLSDYMNGDELDEKAFHAAATIPCGKEDLAEAMVQLRLTQSPAEVVKRAKEEMRAGGYDADKPNIDGRFLDWLRDNC